MTYTATALEIMLASPGDVKDERVGARKVISQWNAENSRESKVVLLTMGWESHAGSDVSGKRAQALINERLVAHADLMIGIFWTRLGTPTGAEDSGTVEEIKLHHSLGKPLMLYFSDRPAPPSQIDTKQYENVKAFRDWAKGEGYISTFKGPDFKEIFRRDLSLMLKDNDRMRGLVMKTIPEPPSTSLSTVASDLLRKIGNTPNGNIALQKKPNSVRLSNGPTILEAQDTVSILKWRAALEELLTHGYIVDKTGRNQLFELTPKAGVLLQT